MNMKTVNRNEIKGDEYEEIFEKESHHNHEIIEDKNRTFRWKKNPDVELLLENLSLNDLCPLLVILGYGKNSEIYRQLYRDMGYSLYGYWEIFYWKVNNKEADNYPIMKDTLREQTKQMVAYLLDPESAKDNEIVEGYTDTFMLAFQEHQSDNKKELHELLAKWSKRSLEYRGIAARRTTSGENAIKYNGRSYGTDDCWKELNELLPDPNDLK